MRLTPGQSLWFVPTQKYRLEGTVTVLKVGRLWATLDNGFRIDLNHWKADGGQYNSPGYCYESEQAFEKVKAAKKRWMEFRQAVNSYHFTPENCGIEQIEAAEKLIFGLNQ